jgi:hypothetical protein
MPAMPRVRTALPWASLPLSGCVTAILVSCGGGGMSSSMDPAATTTAAMSCMSMDMSMSCPAPTIAMVAPGGVVNRTVTLTADVGAVSGDMMVMRVDFLVDGASVAMATMAPYTAKWDTTTVNDGSHTLTAQLSDDMDQTVTSAPVTVRVDNNPAFAVAMTPAQIIPAPASGASGTAALAAKLENGTVSGKVMVSAVAATAVTLNEAFAGNTGSALITLTANGGTAGEWDVPTGTMLTDEQVTALMQGGLYVVAASAANPAGEIRGQITPENVMVTFSSLQGAQEVPPVSIAASGIAATTVDVSANTLTVHVHTSGVADATAANVDNGAMGATGNLLTALTRDDADPGHWSTQLAAVTVQDVANFKADQWYVNVMTATDANGAIRGQIEVPAN